MLAVLRCCTQSSIAAYLVHLKQNCQRVGGIASVDASWSVSVTSTPSLVFVSHSRSEQNTAGSPAFSFCWCVNFTFSRIDGGFREVGPVLNVFDGTPTDSS